LWISQVKAEHLSRRQDGAADDPPNLDDHLAFPSRREVRMNFGHACASR
jgi:hypothetical protein